MKPMKPRLFFLLVNVALVASWVARWHWERSWPDGT
jgi:hypothetical protein